MAAVTGSMGEGRFVVMRFKRIKTWGHVYQVRRHNTREMDCPHTDKDGPQPKLIVGTDDVGGAIRKVLERYDVKHKPGEVLALEFVVSTSREVFDGLESKAYQERNAEFLVCALRAFCDRFKIEGQIVSVAMHEDERTPHLHVVVVPLVCETDKRRKDSTPFYRLSAKRVVGGRGDMTREQTRFASFFKPMGLERGREGSGARHVSNREHEAKLEQARQAALAERDGLALERKAIAAAAVQLGNDRDALASERAQIEAERIRLRQEEERLAAGRAALLAKEKEADALRDRAIERTYKLREMLVTGKKILAYAQSLPVERRTPEIRQASALAQRLATETEIASQGDAWIAAAFAFRSAKGSGAAR